MILSGSHIDTVVNGGNLDGQFGIEAAFMAIKHLKDTYGPPLRSLEVIALAEEEGSRFPYVFWGSKNIVGLARREDVLDIADAKGVGFVNAMRDAGFDFPRRISRCAATSRPSSRSISNRARCWKPKAKPSAW